jgi:hypothetical protein
MKKLRTRKSVGLRDATAEEIPELILRFQEEGYHVVHKTKYSNGKALPYNGILLLKEWRDV